MVEAAAAGAIREAAEGEDGGTKVEEEAVGETTKVEGG